MELVLIVHYFRGVVPLLHLLILNLLCLFIEALILDLDSYSVLFSAVLVLLHVLVELKHNYRHIT